MCVRICECRLFKGYLSGNNQHYEIMFFCSQSADGCWLTHHQYTNHTAVQMEELTWCNGIHFTTHTAGHCINKFCNMFQTNIYRGVTVVAALVILLGLAFFVYRLIKRRRSSTFRGKLVCISLQLFEIATQTVPYVVSIFPLLHEFVRPPCSHHIVGN